jgi:hypothetical protein
MKYRGIIKDRMVYYHKLQSMMTKKNFYVEFNDCIIFEECPQESIMHLFFECSFSQSLWWAMGLEWNTGRNIHDMISDAKTRYSISFIMDIIIIGCWGIWEQRNEDSRGHILMIKDAFLDSDPSFL